MSPDELHAEQIRRLQQDVRDLRDEQAEDMRVLREERLRDVQVFTERIERAEGRVGTLVMVLVGFAFTVAGSALALALSLGSPS